MYMETEEHAEDFIINKGNFPHFFILIISLIVKGHFEEKLKRKREHIPPVPPHSNVYGYVLR